MEIYGEYFRRWADKAIFSYFRPSYRHFFPRLTNRTVFVGQATNLWQISELLQPRIVECCGQRTANW